ncbi:c-type cytochrome biogenesis protein CcmI [Pseudohaliea rubra]|uniref:Cytochrome c heme lyase subunit CcmH n=1 Tax=Pseudohaliea rubra DSM 19751 TaxID=1265313 RepID=A0A095XUP5_9GAMM|nr:c-type cytochrome biogenesis protein CcmI [Pseudohaliea rubra]KGE03416.1 Cytochrome c heme lyase subunit CcmH [Pseudohaliea rubra DSM 19751]
MTVFLLGCAALLVLAALFILRPGARARARAEDAANLDWFRLRRAELAESGEAELLDDARLRVLEDGVEDPTPGAAVVEERFRAAWLLPPLLLVAAGWLYWELGAMADVTLAQRLDTLGEDTPAVEIDALMSDIGARVGQRPENLGYRALLGRYHMARGNYALAAEAYTDLALRAPGDAQALALAAQARFLAADRQLSAEAQRLAEQALAADPRQRTALGLLGMVSFEAGRYRAAIEYWERLVAQEAPDSPSAQMLTDVIASARARLGEAGEEGAGGAAATGPGITVTVKAPAEGTLTGRETVFVLARPEAAASRMPIAVQRFTAAELPRTLRLDDRNSMAGQKLSTAGAVRVFVQVSPGGEPGLANAVLAGSAGPVTASADDAAEVEVLLAPTAG